MKGESVREGYNVVQELMLGLSCTEAFETFFADEAEHSFVRYYENRGEQKINCSNWINPEDPDQQSYDGESVL